MLANDLQLHNLSSIGASKFNPLLVAEYNRDPAFLTLPALTSGDEKLVGLYAVFPTDGFVSFTISGKYTVNWGDGTSNNYTSGATASHTYRFSSVNSALTSKGYKQVLITITPQAGSSITSINLNVKNSSATDSAVYTTGWIDIIASLPKCTTFTMSAASPAIYHRLLERFNLIRSKIASFTRFFAYCTALREVSALDTSSGTAFTYMFFQCTNLQKVPNLTINNVGSIAYMFYQCYKLKEINMTFVGITAFDYAFYQCTSLYNAPNLGTNGCTSFAYGFAYCTNLESIAQLDLYSATGAAALSNLFLGCTNISLPNLINVRTDLSLAGVDMSRAQLVSLFYNLSIAKKTLDLRDVWGASMLTDYDRAIATNKNWTLTG